MSICIKTKTAATPCKLCQEDYSERILRLLAVHVVADVTSCTSMISDVVVYIDRCSDVRSCNIDRCSDVRSCTNDSLLRKTRSPASIHRSNMDSWRWHTVFSKYRIKLIHCLLKYFATHLIQITVNKTLFLFLIFCVFYGKIEINAIGTYIVLFSLLYPQTQTAPQHGKLSPLT